MQNEKIDELIKKIETSLEFVESDLNKGVESLTWKAFVEGQVYAYKSILEQLYKEKIERVWSA